MILKLCVVLILSFYSNAAPVTEEYHFSANDDIASSTDAELGEHFEGDLLLSSAQQRAIQNTGTERNGLRNLLTRWPNRTVVYQIVEDDFDAEEIKKIENGMADIANKSCITFRSRIDNEPAVVIQGSGNGCFSNVGFTGDNSQVLNLSQGCFRHGTIVHEMLHTLGFFHMHSTYDRDDFVDILWDNIIEGYKFNFQKYTQDTVTDFGVQYDYGSVMHYSDKAFSELGATTIVTKELNVTIGQRIGMSERDVIKLNRMYCEDDESISYIV